MVSINTRGFVNELDDRFWITDSDEYFTPSCDLMGCNIFKKSSLFEQLVINIYL